MTTDSRDFKNFDIEDLKGIGPAIANKLRECGITSVEGLSVYSAKELTDLTGIGEPISQKIIQHVAGRKL